MGALDLDRAHWDALALRPRRLPILHTLIASR